MTATALVMARSGPREPMAQTRATARWSLTICQAIDVWETLGRSMPKGRWTACTRPQATTAFRDRRHLHAEIGRRKPLFPNDDRCIQCIFIDPSLELWLNPQTHYDARSRGAISARFSIASRR
ncbi:MULTISPECIES: hypothetical protein [unclassified Bradyrhizobium]|uniref:hypothetical protein n=1 Tax=unclassified Bradyrhizobium TaxID=2631580 RepID=UPI0028E78EEC|nr:MULTISPECIES: hypothetical protein [unclassified Bradyrhizobium]